MTLRPRLRPFLGLLPLAVLAGCAVRPDAHVPPYARVPYQAITRRAVVAIALREWRLWGSRVDDAPPGSEAPPQPEQMAERMSGLWQRVGDYWWLGMDAGTPESRWTGEHDAAGAVFPAAESGRYAWSAAFVSYVMRVAGAGPRFPYSDAHATYIDIAREMAAHQVHGWLVVAERPDAYAPEPGDLICMGRAWAAGITYDRLPSGRFPAHCDIVVASRAGVWWRRRAGMSWRRRAGMSWRGRAMPFWRPRRPGASCRSSRSSGAMSITR